MIERALNINCSIIKKIMDRAGLSRYSYSPTSSEEDRIRIQKSFYILTHFGINVGVRWEWRIIGPFSSELFYILITQMPQATIEDVQFKHERDILKRLTTFKSSIGDILDRYNVKYTIILAASLYIENSDHKTYSKEELVPRLARALSCKQDELDTIVDVIYPMIKTIRNFKKREGDPK